jgi:hypothetical protein
MKVEDIDRFIDRWRATLPPAFTPEYVDGFMRRHRGELHALVLKTLARRGAEGGEAPELLADFLAYDVVAAAQRSVDAQPDAQVLRELWRHVDAQFAQGYNELSVFHNFAVEYIDARTEAIFLRDAGWDVVPLLLERPALAIVAGGHVVAVRDWRGWLKIHPERRGTLNHLFGDLDRAEEKLLQPARDARPGAQYQRATAEIRDRDLEARPQGSPAAQPAAAVPSATSRADDHGSPAAHVADHRSPRCRNGRARRINHRLQERHHMNIRSFARITLGAALLAESGMALHRFEARRRGFEAAARRASALGRPLVVVGDPDAGAHTRLVRAYECGDLCIDLRGCPRCQVMQAADITGGPVPGIADDSAVVFVLVRPRIRG